MPYSVYHPKPSESEASLPFRSGKTCLHKHRKHIAKQDSTRRCFCHLQFRGSQSVIYVILCYLMLSGIFIYLYLSHLSWSSTPLLPLATGDSQFQGLGLPRCSVLGLNPQMQWTGSGPATSRRSNVPATPCWRSSSSCSLGKGRDCDMWHRPSNH